MQAPERGAGKDHPRLRGQREHALGPLGVIVEEPAPPLEREPLDETEVAVDLVWADGKHFPS